MTKAIEIIGGGGCGAADEKNNIVDEEDQPPYSQLKRWRNGKAEPAAYTLY